MKKRIQRRNEKLGTGAQNRKLYFKRVPLPGIPNSPGRMRHSIMRQHGNLVPRLFLRGRKDPGRSWLRATQILGGKLKQHLGRGGRVLRLENHNLCA